MSSGSLDLKKVYQIILPMCSLFMVLQLYEKDQTWRMGVLLKIHFDVLFYLNE